MANPIIQPIISSSYFWPTPVQILHLFACWFLTPDFSAIYDPALILGLRVHRLFIEAKEKNSPWKAEAGWIIQTLMLPWAAWRLSLGIPCWTYIKLLWIWWIKTKTRPLYSHVWTQRKIPTLSKPNKRPNLFFILSNMSDCCFFTNHNFALI